MSIWRYNQAEDDYEAIPPDEQEYDEPYDYCSTCQHAGICADKFSVPPCSAQQEAAK